MNKATKRNVLASALLSIMLCVSLIVGATYALFTSESKVNVAVTSGKVDVRASLENLDLYSPTAIDYETKEITNAENAADNENKTFKNGGTAKIDDNTLTLTNVTPGDKAIVTIKVRNYSNVTVQYHTILACESDNGLFSGLNVTIAGERYEGETRVSDWTFLMPANDPDNAPVASFDVAVELPSTAGNEYQGKTCTISYTVEAVQGNAETSAPDPDTYYIYTANDLVNLGNVADRYDNVLLMKDIDMEGIAYMPFELILNAKTFTFDGNGHTIKNFKPTGLTAAAGNFCYNALIASVDAGIHNVNSASTLAFKDLTVEAAEVKQAKGDLSIAAVLLADAKSGCSVSVENCTVKDSTIESDDFASALIGYGSGSFDWVTREITNCTVENCKIIGNGNTAALMALENNTNTLTVKGAKIDKNEIDGKNGHSAAVLLGAGSLTATDVKATDNTISGGAGCNEDYKDETYGVFHVFNSYEINGTVYCASAYLKDILTGKNSVTLDKNYVLLDAWTPIAPGGTYTLTGTTDEKGIGRFISGLTAQLFQDNAAQNLTIENITIKDSTEIKYLGHNATAGHGAFISGITGTISFKNCHLYDVTVVAPGDDRSGVGGFVGQASGSVTIENCSVRESTINGDSSSAAFVGYHQGGTLTVTNGIVENCTITSSDRGNWRVGAIIATVNGGSTATLTNCSASNITFEMENSSAMNPNHVLWGRNSSETNSSITIDGVKVA